MNFDVPLRSQSTNKYFNLTNYESGIAQCLKEKQVSIQEIAVSNMISIEAMVRVLVKKGLVTQQELLEEIKLVELAQESERN